MEDRAGVYAEALLALRNDSHRLRRQQDRLCAGSNHLLQEAYREALQMHLKHSFAAAFFRAPPEAQTAVMQTLTCDASATPAQQELGGHSISAAVGAACNAFTAKAATVAGTIGLEKKDSPHFRGRSNRLGMKAAPPTGTTGHRNYSRLEGVNVDATISVSKASATALTVATGLDGKVSPHISDHAISAAADAAVSKLTAKAAPPAGITGLHNSPKYGRHAMGAAVDAAISAFTAKAAAVAVESTSARCNLCVFGLPDAMDELSFSRLFQQFGEVRSAKVLAAKNCGFVRFASWKEAEAATSALNNLPFQGGTLQVRLAEGERMGTPAIGGSHS